MTISKWKRPFTTFSLCLFIIMIATALMLVIDTQHLINNAYSLMSVAWRLLTYAVIFFKSPTKVRGGLFVLFLINEGFIFSYSVGGLAWS